MVYLDGCSNLTGNIPENLFANCINVEDFYFVFDSCSGLTGSIPENLFANCPKVSRFTNSFARCTNLTGDIPENLFRNCINVTSFASTFEGCSGLNGLILEKIFAANLITEREPIQKEIVSKLNMLDFYFEIAFKKKYISEKQCHRYCNELLAITKMTYGWIKNAKC